MLPPTLTATPGTMEFVKPVPKEVTSTLTEFAKMLLTNVILGTMLMVSASAAIKDMTLLMELVNCHLKIMKDPLIKDAKLGIKEFVFNVLLDGFSITMELVFLLMISAELMMSMDSA